MSDYLLYSITVHERFVSSSLDPTERYPVTAMVVAAPLPRFMRRWLRVLYILQKKASYPGIKKAIFAGFHHPKNSFTSITRCRYSNAVHCISEFIFGRIWGLIEICLYRIIVMDLYEELILFLPTLFYTWLYVCFLFRS